jgi:hypothetical protein
MMEVTMNQCRSCVNWGVEDTPEERAVARWLTCELPLPARDREVREWVLDDSRPPLRERYVGTGEYVRVPARKLGAHAEYCCNEHRARPAAASGNVKRKEKAVIQCPS